MSARILTAGLLLALLAGPPASGQNPDSRPTLQPFESESALVSFLDDFFRRQQRTTRLQGVIGDALGFDAAPAEMAAPAIPAEAESITNVQHAGVDEGGIVKVHGDHLVILRRGRLFTVRIGDAGPAPVDAVDAFAPDIDPGGAWYDEMLISGNVVMVIGYSYQRGGTEIGLFEIDAQGGLRHASTYHLRSNDYYSSRNYASRLVDGRLVFYAPLGLWHYRRAHRQSLDDVLPAMRRWGGRDEGFVPIASATSIYRPARDLDPGGGIALHTVTSCEIEGFELHCKATAVLGPWGHVFYVSPGSVYVWLAGRARRGGHGSPAVLYRMPFDGARPSAIGVSGSPIDQFSFLESDDEHLNVLVSARGGGQWMWHAERPQGGLMLLRVPLKSLGDGRDDAPARAYLTLPAPDGYQIRNRFVGDHLLYGAGSGWGGRDAESKYLYAVEWRTGRLTVEPLTHAVDRIEVMGTGAVVVGSRNDDLVFSSIRLEGRPGVAGQYVLSDAAQGETRSHGFFYRSDDRDSGVLGLPIVTHRVRSNPLTGGSAAITYLRSDDLSLSEVGRLDARPETAVNDGCRASCVDWYGNARPIFLRGRVFALLGYEMVEGRVVDGSIREVARASFAPLGQVVRRP